MLQNCWGAGAKGSDGKNTKKNKWKLYQNGQIDDICCHAYVSKAYLNRLLIGILYPFNSPGAPKPFNENKIFKDILDFEYISFWLSF